MRAASSSRRCGSGRPRLCGPRHPSAPCPWGVQRPGRTRGPRGPGRRPRGSRIGDVTWARIVRVGLAGIERRRIPSRWARTARGGMDFVALGSHYASRDWPAPAPARPGIGLRWPESWRGSGRGGGEGYSGVVLKMWGVRVVVVVCSGGSSSSEGLLRGRPSASPGCDARGRWGRWGAGVGRDGPRESPPGASGESGAAGSAGRVPGAGRAAARAVPAPPPPPVVPHGGTASRMS